MNETLLFLVDATQVDDFTEYTIDVHHGGNIWKVKHRYSEFKVLHDALRLKYPSIEKNLLPPKKLFGKLSPSFIDKRKKELELYLQTLVSKTYPSGLPLVLRQFLHFHLYDVEMLCQILAEKLYKVGDGILMSGSAYTFNTLQLWAITERISLQKPNTDSDNPNYDFGHVLDFVQNLKYLRIICNRGYVGSSNIISEELTFDLSLFRSLTQLVADGCSSDQAQSIAKLRRQLSSLSVHQSISSIKSLLTGGFDMMGASENWNLLIFADFSDNQISVIDESVKLMPCVEFLDLSKNTISKIENLQLLTALTFVDLSNNVIDEFDYAHARLGNVKTLILAHNKLKSLRGFGKLYALEVLDVSHNYIAELNEIDHVANLPCISKLNLSNNSVTTELDYRTRTLSKFASRACEVCLDEIQSTQKELDTAAVLHAIFKSRKISQDSPKERKKSIQSGKFTSSPVEIKQKTLTSSVLSAPGRFCLTPDEMDRARREHFNHDVVQATTVASRSTSGSISPYNFKPHSGDMGSFESGSLGANMKCDLELTSDSVFDHLKLRNEIIHTEIPPEKPQSRMLPRVSEVDEPNRSPVKTAPESLKLKQTPTGDDCSPKTKRDWNKDIGDDENDDCGDDKGDNADNLKGDINANQDDSDHVFSDESDSFQNKPDSNYESREEEVAELVEEILTAVCRCLSMQQICEEQNKLLTLSCDYKETKESETEINGNIVSANDRSRKHSNTTPLDDSKEDSFSSAMLDDDNEAAWSCSLVVKSSDNETDKSIASPARAQSYAINHSTTDGLNQKRELKPDLENAGLMIEPVMNMQFRTVPLRHLAMLKPLDFYKIELQGMNADERLVYVTWSHVIFYDRSSDETPCVVLMTNQALYFIADLLTVTRKQSRDVYDLEELDGLKSIGDLSQRRFQLDEDGSKSTKLDVGLFGQCLRFTGSNPSLTATLVTRSLYLTRNLVTYISHVFKRTALDTTSVQNLLNQSNLLLNTELNLSNLIISISNEQAMMEFNLTTVESGRKNDLSDQTDSSPQLLLYLLIRLRSSSDERAKTFLLTTQFCCLCDENLVSYPIPEFEFDSPVEHRYRNIEILSLSKLTGLCLSDAVDYDLAILFNDQRKWLMSFRDYTERDRLMRVLCEQYYKVKGKSLLITLC